MATLIQTLALTPGAEVDPVYTAQKGIANGAATLDASTLVVEPVQVVHETSGPSNLTVGAWPDGEMPIRSGLTIISRAPVYERTLRTGATTAQIQAVITALGA